MSEIHVALTGHRPHRIGGYNLSAPIWRQLASELEAFLEQGLALHDRIVCHSGMALGCDTVWSEVIIKLRLRYGEHRVGFIAEVPFPQQADRWNTPDQLTWGNQLQYADEIRHYAQSYSPRALHARNEGMIAASKILVAVWDGLPQGGTAGAVRFAEKQGVHIVRIHPQDLIK